MLLNPLTRLNHLPLRFITGFACLLLAGSLAAQSSRLTLYVFNEGSPIGNIEVLIDGELKTWTDSGGLAGLNLDPGIKVLELRYQDSVVLEQQILAVQDEISQWIVDLTGGGSALFEVESSSPPPGQPPATKPLDSQPGGAPGTIEGHLISAEDGSPISGARIFISGVSEQIRSDENGRFSAVLPSGTRSVSVLHAGFNTLTRDGIEIPADDAVTLSLELTPAGSELPEFVVVAPYISGSLASVMAERRESDGVTDVLSAEQISRAGDSDAAGALKRVTGLTLVDGQYIYVRGLGERYSSVVLNNATIPSPDPTRRVVPLDLFPTDVIEAVVVQKTAAANLPGEFGGGTVQLRTVSFPPELTAKLSLSLGYRDDTTFETGLSYGGGDTDWLGYDDGARDLPGSLATAIADGQFLRPRSFTNPDGLTQEELEALGQDMAANSTYDLQKKDIPQDIGLSGSFGHSFAFGDTNRWGFLTAFRYGNTWSNANEVRREFSAVSGGGLQLADEVDVVRTINNIDASLFANTGVEFGDNHEVGFNAMLLRQTEDETRISQGVEDSQVLRRFKFQWVENELLSYQATGSHTLPFKNWTLDWQYTDATATRAEPNTRSYRRDDDDEDGIYTVSTRADSNEQTWSDLEDTLKHGSLDTTLPLNFGRHALAIRAGLGELERDREASIRTFAFQGRLPNDLLDLPYSELFTDEYIDPSILQLRESTRATDTYTASQSLDSRFLNLDLSLFNEALRISAGVREENNRQQVITADLSNPNAPPVIGEIDQTDRLPSASVTWAYNPSAQIRAAYAESVSRPDFRELSPAPYLDPLLDLITVGNPVLQTAELKNYDLRWEYYFSPNESFSIAAFYKAFAKPIEKTFSSGGSARIITLQNALAADLVGVELDYSRSLGWIRNHDWLNWLENLDLGFAGPFDWEGYYVAFNYAWIESSVEIDSSLTTQTNPDRPLQGQSPWVVNVQLGYSSPDSPGEWSLLYNEFGKRITQAGVLGQPDIYEEAFPQLDFVYKRRLGEGWRFTLKLKNLLDPDVKYTQGDQITRAYRRGREIDLGLQWSF
ncbi:TonB-dependent receptor [Elongatibacter sediminis]|uniref:TonB-dependent receptor n=1 Tax=Elongatibacter sediminis TaxID=3119006 RepID=A0AAW9RG75_9GAMM